VFKIKQNCPVIWREDRTPEAVQHCRDCGLIEHGSRMIWGEGNPAAPVMIVLDNPGAREDKEGNPFLCGTRQTLQQAAYEVGFSEHDLYITYVLKRRPRKAYNKDHARSVCMQHLLGQLELQQPRLVFCLGNTAVQHFFHDAAVEVKQLRTKWHVARQFQTLVSYHPLAVRRRPNLWRLFVADWMMLAAAYRN